MQETSSSLKNESICAGNQQKHKSCSTDTSGDQVSTTTKTPKTADLSNLEVSEFITCHKMKMKNKDEFFAVAHVQNEQGKNNLANFISLHSLKPLRKLFAS